MAVYEYSLMLRLARGTARVCSHDNLLSWSFVFFPTFKHEAHFVKKKAGKNCKFIYAVTIIVYILCLALSTSRLHLAQETLITLEINPYNGCDCIDIREACFFYTNTPPSLRGSAGSFDAIEAGDDLGNGSGAEASWRGHPGVCVSARPPAGSAQHQHIDLGQKVID